MIGNKSARLFVCCSQWQHLTFGAQKIFSDVTVARKKSTRPRHSWIGLSIQLNLLKPSDIVTTFDLWGLILLNRSEVPETCYFPLLAVRLSIWFIVYTWKQMLSALQILQTQKFMVVQSTARHAVHLRFVISSNALEIRAVQSPKCMIWCAVDCTFNI
jgi:hypothetical protein